MQISLKLKIYNDRQICPIRWHQYAPVLPTDFQHESYASFSYASLDSQIAFRCTIHRVFWGIQVLTEPTSFPITATTPTKNLRKEATVSLLFNCRLLTSCFHGRAWEEGPDLQRWWRSSVVELMVVVPFAGFRVCNYISLFSVLKIQCHFVFCVLFVAEGGRLIYVLLSVHDLLAWLGPRPALKTFKKSG